MHEFLKYACMPSTINRAVRVALIITPILTVINHFQEIRELRLGGEFWLQVGLTFLVPFCVSTFSSAQGAREEHNK